MPQRCGDLWENHSVGDDIVQMGSVAPSRFAESAFVVSSQPAATAPSASASDNDNAVEITLDLRDDSAVAVHSVLAASWNDSLIASSTAPHGGGSSCTGPRTDRSLFGSVHRLMGLNLVRGGAGAAADWAAVEKRFNELQVDDHLFRSRFSKCVGIDASDEFTSHLFDALARRLGICRDRDWRDQISNNSAEIRLETFFDM